MRFEDPEFEEAREQFAKEARTAFEKLAATHFPGLFLRGFNLQFSVYELETKTEWNEICSMEGQSLLTTIGMLEHGKHMLLAD